MQVLLQFLPSFLLVFCRITAFFVSAPLFSSSRLPVMLKVGLSFYVALIVFSALGGGHPVPLDWTFMLDILKESIVGLLLGFTGTLFFTAVQMAGAFVDMQIGFSLVNVFDPMTGAQSPVLGNLKYLAATLTFLLVNGHHYLLMAIMSSYQWIPLNPDMLSAFASGKLSDFLIHSFATVFYLSVQMIAPALVSLFLVDLALGVLSRVAPQFNLFAVGFPVKVLSGFMILIVVFPGFIILYRHLFQVMFNSMQNLLQAFST